ncbi:hypothetical protein A3K93_00970 [Acinetobacter sp. NCu2D-2]|uniref:hypothetical protein n=1 Tax=Acinetobacter sp. NCu2D-2 TaxID=1608473 RepID=UPI0007CDF18B|nr:hypothetical protein [Acinetobacter sp. NCu2D-2]ANF80893.1 hypothetical protein A3K93_00970 [Acinetobacter sp. NCu2D-2]
MFNNIFKLTSLALATSLLVACGGSSSGGSGFKSKTINGTAVDFYLAGADVKFTNVTCQNLYPNLKTDENGKFTFQTTQACQETGIKITGGVDTVTGKIFTGELKVKSANYSDKASPSVVASPLTTLQEDLNLSDSDFNKVLTFLGFDANTDVTTFDPLSSNTAASASQTAAIFLVQQILNELQDSDLSPTAAANAIRNAALAPNTTPIISGETFNTTAITNIFTQASLPSTAATNVNTIATSLNTILAEGSITSGETLVAALENPTNSTIIDALENIQAPKVNDALYNTLSFFGESINALKNSSTTAPITLAKNRNNLESLAGVSFGLSKSLSTTDSVALGFTTQAKFTTGNWETVEVYISNANITFTGGDITQLVLPTGAKIEIRSTLAGFPSGSFELDTSKTIPAVSNTVSFIDIINAYPNVLNQPYEIYINHILNSNQAVSIQTRAYVRPENYPVAAGLGLDVGTFTLSNGSTSLFAGTTATGYFEIQ